MDYCGSRQDGRWQLGLLQPFSAQQAPAVAPAPIKLGIVSFLSGLAASPFGVPGRNGAEIVIEALSAGKAPAPYNTVGFGGAKIETKLVDEAGSTAQVVTEFRNLVQRDQVDAVVGYISSGSCLAVTPVADELKGAHGLFRLRHAARLRGEAAQATCSAPRRTRRWMNTARGPLPAREEKRRHAVLGHQPELRVGPGLSWKDFVAAMGVLAPKAKVDKELFPKLFQGEYGAEISTLLDVEVASSALELLGR